MTSPIKVWRYSLPNIQSQGWVIAFLDSTGVFCAVSDWGDCSFRWNSRGIPEGQDFRQFLLSCDDYYLTSKLGQNRREYDAEGTLATVRAHILEQRRTREWDKAKSREEWDSLLTYENLGTEFDFTLWCSTTGIACAGELYRTRYVGDVTAFVKHAMPRLREAFKLELESERTTKEVHNAT